MNSKVFIEETAGAFESLIDEVINAVDGMNHKALLIPEAEGKWNMLQCIKHMSLATQVYVRNAEEKLANTSNPISSGQFKGSWKGRWFVKMNEPKENGHIPSKLKTFKTMEPQSELDKQEVVDEFISTHQKFISLIKASEGINLDKTRIPTAIPIVKLRLGDAYRFILAHTKRHVVQLKRIKSTVIMMGAN